MPGSHGTRLLQRVTVGLLASLVLSAPFALTPVQAQLGSCGVDRGPWLSIPAPDFPEGSPAISDFEVGPMSSSPMYVTNGTVVMRSTDGGCTWRNPHQPEAGAGLVGAAAGIRVTEISMPAARVAGRAYVAIEEAAGPAARPRVQTTSDSGATWSEASSGLPPAGTPALLRAAPSSADTVYLTIEVQGVVELLYGSDDGGMSWTLRSNFARSLGSGVNDLRVDPLDPNTLWVAADDGLYRSTDGGLSFAAIEDFAGKPTVLVDVFHNQGGPASIIGFFRAEDAFLSEDGGETWLEVSTPGEPSSAAHGSHPQLRMMSSASRVWVYTPNLFSWVDARAPVPNITGLIGGHTQLPTFYGFTATSIEVYRGAVGEDVKTPPGTVVIPDISVVGREVDPPKPPELSPDGRVVQIAAGRSKTVPYRLRVPRTQVPLDVYLLVDTSSSQRRFLPGVVAALEDIMNGLRTSGVDVQLGMAEYRNYPHSEPPRVAPPGAPCAGNSPTCHETNYIYRQVQDLSVDVGPIVQALENVEAGGGGHYNAQPAALLHTAIAAGEDVEPFGPSPHTDVPPGTNASFRREALRVALIISDEKYIYEALAEQHDPTPPDLPTFDEVSSALNVKDIKQVGISLRVGGAGQATADMREMAAATDAVAPPGGVDCDGDREIDVPEAAPLVCEVNKETVEAGGSLAPAIVNLVESIRTRASLSLAVDAREDLVQKVTPKLYEAVALQGTRELTYDVTFRCPLSLAEKRLPVTLTAQGVTPEVSVAATVVCGGVAEENDLPFDLENLLGLLPLIPVSPPPPLTEVASSTQAQAQSQAQAQAQAAMAAQEQEQPQLAFVHAMHAMRQKMAEDYAMSSYRKSASPTPGMALAAAAAVLSAAFALLMTRQARSPRLARSRLR